MFTDIPVSHFRASRICVKVCVSHQTCVRIQPDASMHIFRHVLFAYFASLSSGIPILVQVFLRELRLPVNGYVSLNKVSFWTRRVLKSVKIGKKDYFCATNDHFFPKNLIPLC